MSPQPNRFAADYPDGRPPRRHIIAGLKVSVAIAVLTAAVLRLAGPEPPPALTEVEGRVESYAPPPRNTSQALRMTLRGVAKTFTVSQFTPVQQQVIAELPRRVPTGSQVTLLVASKTLEDAAPFAFVYGVRAGGQDILSAAQGWEGDQANEWWTRCIILTGAGILLTILWSMIVFPRISGMKYFLRGQAR